MSNKKLLIASSSRHEAITKWIRENNLLDLTVDLIFISDLLNEYDIKDELNDNHAVIRWYESNGLKYSNETHCLLNRVSYLEDVSGFLINKTFDFIWKKNASSISALDFDQKAFEIVEENRAKHVYLNQVKRVT